MTGLTLEPVLAQIRADLMSGRVDQALQLAQAATEAFDDRHEAHYALASALTAKGGPASALSAFTMAQSTQGLRMLADGGVDLVRLQTDSAYAMAIGRRFYNANMLGAATLACGCTAHDPNAANGAGNGLHVWAQAIFHQGASRMEEALRAFTAAFNAAPTSALYSFILYTLFFVENGRPRHADEARRWAKMCAEPFTPANPVFEVERHSNRRLRVGYLAPSFTTNQTRQFAQWVIDGHDPARFEVFVYVDDAAREKLADHVTVRSVSPLTYEMNATLIRRDKIDILVDCWGHAANNRMLVFARKPAPVQVSWLNYVQTTGMSAMDYVVHSDFMESPGREALFTEEIVSAGPIVAAFRPDPVAQSSPAPVLRNGYVTFASFNHPDKISEVTIANWARIIKAAPTAKLLFKYSFFVDPVVQETLRAKFLGYGADPDALMFEGFSKGAEYEEAFARVDIMLDPSPVNGGTTTMQAFSHGIPVLTLDDRSDYYARIGVQALMALGMDEMIFTDWDGYVGKAVALANDPQALSDLRARMRPAFDASAYRDEAAFIARMEDLYASMFETWLAKSVAHAAA